jgi:hypothetical protein
MLVTLVRTALVATPIFALVVGPLLIGGTEPRVLGMPPIMWWILVWVVLTPPCLLGVERLRRR